MSIQLQKRLITADEFEERYEDCRYDLVRGELVDMPPMAGLEHGIVGDRLASRASVYADDHDLGAGAFAETRFTIERNPDTSIGPDWAFIAKDRLPRPAPKGYAAIVPDLILEVRSPSDTPEEAEGKMQRWVQAGVRLGWELNLKERVLTVYRPNEEPRTVDINGTIDGEDVLPGFTFPMRRLFPEAP